MICIGLIKLIIIKTYKYYLVSSLIIFLIFYIFYFFSKSMGGGDGKLFSALGLCFGIKATAIIFLISIFSAFPFALYYSINGKKKNIAFAPFITLGTVIFLILSGIDIRW